MKYVNIIISIFILVFVSTNVNGNELPTHLDKYLSTYAGKYEIVLRHFENNTDPLPIKLRDFEKATEALKGEFRGTMRKIYAKGPFKVSGKFQCTKGSSGGSKKCGPHCVSTPDTNAVYEIGSGHVLWNNDPNKRKSWGKASGKSEYCYTKKKSGKGKDKYTVGASFALPKAYVYDKAEKDVYALFNYIITNAE
jgi:hypothetical protein